MELLISAPKLAPRVSVFLLFEKTCKTSSGSSFNEASVKAEKVPVSLQVTICYGMTETSPVSFQTTVDDPVEKRLETVGRIQPHTEAKVVDPESRKVLPVNTPGELVVRGYLTMKSYWDEPEKTREVKDNEGWVSTGDLAAFDERGYCSITGRIKDMVIRGGQNLFPKEIEGKGTAQNELLLSWQEVLR